MPTPRGRGTLTDTSPAAHLKRCLECGACIPAWERKRYREAIRMMEREAQNGEE